MRFHCDFLVYVTKADVMAVIMKAFTMGNLAGAGVWIN